MSYDYDKMVKDLMTAQDESMARKDEGGNRKWGGLFVSPLPTGTPPFWKVAEGEHLLDVVGFEVKTDGHFNGKKIGDFAYTLEYYRHEKIGSLEENKLCVHKCLGKPCLICLWRELEIGCLNPNKNVFDLLKYKRRNLYNIWVHDNSEEEKKDVQLWDASWYIFEKPVADRAKLPMGGGTIYWTAPDTKLGKSIYFKRTGKGMTNTEYTTHTLMDRKLPIPERILDKAVSLETLVHVPTPEELFELMLPYMRDEQKKQLENAFRKSFASYPSAGATGSAPNVGQSSVSSQFSPPPPPSAPENDIPFSPPPPAQPEEKSSKNQCPAGGVFGEDTDALPANMCEGCAVWDACAEAKAGKSASTSFPLPDAKPSLEPSPAQQQPAPKAPEPTTLQTSTAGPTTAPAAVTRKKRFVA